jgi:hypothetical protein
LDTLPIEDAEFALAIRRSVETEGQSHVATISRLASKHGASVLELTLFQVRANYNLTDLERRVRRTSHRRRVARRK